LPNHILSHLGPKQVGLCTDSLIPHFVVGRLPQILELAVGVQRLPNHLNCIFIGLLFATQFHLLIPYDFFGGDIVANLGLAPVLRLDQLGHIALRIGQVSLLRH
jgi:hypothetical protein